MCTHTHTHKHTHTQTHTHTHTYFIYRQEIRMVYAAIHLLREDIL